MAAGSRIGASAHHEIAIGEGQSINPLSNRKCVYITDDLVGSIVSMTDAGDRTDSREGDLRVNRYAFMGVL
jgi:hypothetical protein